MGTPVADSMYDNSVRDGTADTIDGAEVDYNPNLLASILDGTEEVMLNADTTATNGLRIRVPEIVDVSAAAGGIRTGLRIRHDPASGTATANDGVKVLFQGDDDAGNKTDFGSMEVVFTATTNGAESSRIDFKGLSGGASATFLSVGPTGVAVLGTWQNPFIYGTCRLWDDTTTGQECTRGKRGSNPSSATDGYIIPEG